jgi:hypothetical protein
MVMRAYSGGKNMSSSRAGDGPVLPGASDKRGSGRLRQLKSGIIVLNDRRSTLGCMIRDLSDTGARLKFGSVVVLPDEFELIFVQERKIVGVRKCWHRQSECGVTFTGPKRPVPAHAMIKG